MRNKMQVVYICVDSLSFFLSCGTLVACGGSGMMHPSLVHSYFLLFGLGGVSGLLML